MARKKCGIYCIENKVNAKKYIGQSIDIASRWSQHKRDSVISRDTFLYQAMQKYGIENFKFYILEECNSQLLDEREKFWIDYYDTFKHGYNMTLGGQGIEGYHLQRNIAPSNLKQLNGADSVVKIAKLDKEFNILEVYPSVQECARKNNIEATNISKTATAKHKTCHGYIFMYYEDIKNMNNAEIKEYRNRQRETLQYSNSYSTSKRIIYLIDENDNVLQTFPSISNAAKLLKLDASSITKVCKGRLKQIKGYRFRYA